MLNVFWLIFSWEEVLDCSCNPLWSRVKATVPFRDSHKALKSRIPAAARRTKSVKTLMREETAPEFTLHSTATTQQDSKNKRSFILHLRIWTVPLWPLFLSSKVRRSCVSQLSRASPWETANILPSHGHRKPSSWPGKERATSRANPGQGAGVWAQILEQESDIWPWPQSGNETWWFHSRLSSSQEIIPGWQGCENYPA